MNIFTFIDDNKMRNKDFKSTTNNFSFQYYLPMPVTPRGVA